MGSLKLKRRRNGNHIYSGEPQASQSTSTPLNPVHVTVMTKRKKVNFVAKSFINSKPNNVAPSLIPEPAPITAPTDDTPMQDPETTTTSGDGAIDPQDPSPKKVQYYSSFARPW